MGDIVAGLAGLIEFLTPLGYVLGAVGLVALLLLFANVVIYVFLMPIFLWAKRAPEQRTAGALLEALVPLGLTLGLLGLSWWNVRS